MPLSAAEKQRRYRERLKNNSEKYEAAKQKHRERYHKTKRLVKDLTPKEKYNANVIWRIRKREQKKKKQIIERLLENTPPSSPRPDAHLNVRNETPSPSLDNSPAVQMKTTRSRALRSSSYYLNSSPPPVTSSPVILLSITPPPTTPPPISESPFTLPQPYIPPPAVLPPLPLTTPTQDISTPDSPKSAAGSTTAVSSSFLCGYPTLTTPSSSVTPSIATSSSAKERGRKKVKKDRSKVYRENDKLKKENEKLKKKYERYKKRYQRHNTTEKTVQDDGLRYRVLSKAIIKTFRNTRSRKERQVIKNIFSTVEIKDSRIKKKLLKDNLGVDKIIKDKYCLDRETILKKRIKDFFHRDDIIRATAGKKETITKNGVKSQKRYLLDTMKNLHQTFKKENPELHCSYFYFTRNKPFYVVDATVDARDMCMCKTHTNFAYKAKALKNKGITGTDDPNILIELTVCDVFEKDCMYGICDKCKDKTYNYNNEKIAGVIGWTEWTRKEEKYEKDGKTMKAIRNIREELSENAKDFMKIFEKDLAAFKKHVFNIKSQFRNFRRCLEQIQPNECIIIVDFSENYNCKYHKEIQHHHFAGSRNQISLHTVVVYTFDDQISEGYKINSFCTVSASNVHQPAAIWSHLDPILKFVRSEFTGIDTVHFYSDGPSTQYRQKQNFYFMCSKLFDYGFEAMTWSFFEAGHGKGPADGVGGFLKRTADKIVANGQDIADVFQFYEKLHDISKVKLFLIDEKNIHNLQKTIPTNIPRLVGTLKFHQVFTNCYGTLKYRDLSCFCEKGMSEKRGFCMCLEPKTYDIRVVCDNINNDEHLSVQSAKDVVNYNAGDVVNDNVGAAVNGNAPQKLPENSSSDDDEPLNILKLNKELEDITNKRRKSIYEAVYGHSSDDEQSCSSYDKENSQIGNGDFLLVNVYVDATNNKKKTYTYACKTISDIEEDGEIKVMFLRVVDKTGTRFRLDENDICYIDYEDVIEKLPNPDIVKRGHRAYYKFKHSVNVFEK